MCFRSVVEVVKMLLDFIETLEEKLDSVQSCTTTRDRISQLVSSTTSVHHQNKNLSNKHEPLHTVLVLVWITQDLFDDVTVNTDIHWCKESD